jgi:aminomuconate-semialdehyde/2-hydroxymuconate-6-semialdehyde dehydrogenase
MSLEQIQNYIDGRLFRPSNGKWLDNFEPATGQVYSQVPDSDAADIDLAVQSATAAFPKWAAMNVYDRSAILNRVADAIEKNMELLIQAESKDNGKPIWLARSVDIPRCAKNLRFFANLATGAESQSHEAVGMINFTLRQPLGAVGCISPWNLPLYLFTWKIAPALAAGNTVVAKPSEVTPMTAYLFSKLCIDSGLPPGVLNIVHGSGAQTGDALINHNDVKAISFTGGTRTGRHIASVVAPKLKKLSLELGGKNPNLIFADCDYKDALQTTLRSSFANQGQICLCGSRIYVEKPLYEKFRDDMVAKASQLKVGDPKDSDSVLGAVVSSTHHEKILGCIDRAEAEGGKILCGGNAVKPSGRCAGGWFVAPTVIEGLPNQCRTNQEEIFGPVVTIQPFEGEAEAIKFANETEYGLSATVWSSNVGKAHRVAHQIEAGVIWINCWLVRDLRTPFGGMKQSGVGREGGMEAMRFWTESKNVCVNFA